MFILRIMYYKLDPYFVGVFRISQCQWLQVLYSIISSQSPLVIGIVVIGPYFWGIIISLTALDSKRLHGYYHPTSIIIIYINNWSKIDNKLFVPYMSIKGYIHPRTYYIHIVTLKYLAR